MIHKQNILPTFIITGLSAAALLSIAFFIISLNAHTKIKREIAFTYDVIDEYAQKSKMPISKESIALLTDERNKLKSVYARFKLALLSPLTDEVPESDLDPLQFKERLIQTQKKLREDARRHDLLLPKDLGFARYETELSKRSEIPHSIRRLRLLEELISLMIYSDVGQVKEISFPIAEADGQKLPSRPSEEERSGAGYDIPVSVAIECTSAQLLELLYQARLSPYALTVDDMDIKRLGESALTDKAGTGKPAAERKVAAQLKIRATALQ